MRLVRIVMGIVIFIILFSAILYFIPFGRARVRDAQELETFNGKVYIGSGKRLELWETDTAHREETLTLRSNITDLASDERLYLGTKNGTILVLNSSTKKTERCFQSDSSIVQLQKREKLYALMEDGRIVGLGEEKIMFTPPIDGDIKGFCVSPSDSIAYWSGSSGVHILEEGNSTQILEVKDVTDCAFSEDGKLAVAYKKKVQVYNTTTLEVLFEEGLEEAEHRVGFTNGGKNLVCSGGTQAFRLWSLESQGLIEKRDFEEDTVKDLEVDNDRFSVMTEDRVYLYNSEAALKKRIQSSPEVPLFLPLVAVGAGLLSILTIWSELDRQHQNVEKFYFRESKLPYDEGVLLGSLGIFGMTSFLLYLFIHMEVLISMGLWVTPLFVALLWVFLLFYVLVRPREVKLDSNTFYFSTSLFQEHFKGWGRKTKLNNIRAVHPDYFYNKAQETFDQTGFQILTIEGDPGKVLFTMNNREKNTRRLERAMKKAFGPKWDRVYVDEPYIDEERWEEIGHLADKSLRMMTVKMMVFVTPIFAMQIVASFFLDKISIEIFFLILGGAGALAMGGVLYVMSQLRKVKEAQSIKAKKEIGPDQTTSYTPVAEEVEKDEIDPEKYLDYTKKDWKEVDRKLQLERPLMYLAFGLMGALLIVIMVGASTTNLLLLIVGAILPAPLFFLVFYMNKITKARNMVKNAVEHELRTGEKVLPTGFEIPPPLMGDYISREPIDVTEKERRLADKWTDEIQNVKMMIFISIGIFIPIGIVMIYNDLFQGQYGTYIVFALIFLPIIFIMWYSFRKGKIVGKVKEAEKIEELLEEQKKDEGDRP